MRCTSTIYYIFLIFSAYTAVTHAASLPAGLIKLQPYQAPRIILSDLDDKSFSLDEYQGHWVFVHFWASWCAPCRREMPAVERLRQAFNNTDLTFAVINTAEDDDTVFSFLSIHAPSIRPLMDRDGQVTEQWQPRGLPATYLVDPKGQVRYQALGGRAWDTKPYMDFLHHLTMK